MRAIDGLLVIAVAGCSASGTADRTDPIPFTPDGGGIALNERPLRIDFGRTASSTVPAMTKLVGRPPVGDGGCGEPGVSFVDWPDGTRLIFARGAFVGWSARGGRAGQGCSA